MNKIVLYIFLLFSLSLLGCEPGAERSNTDQLYVVATTQMIADAASIIGGDMAEVEFIMGPGVDPHLYRATPGDFRKMENANVILYNGLLLEGRLSDILEKLGDKAHAVSSSIPDSLLISAYDFGGIYDPHIWFDISLWKYAVNDIESQLSKRAPEHEKAFQDNKNSYLAELDSLEQFIRKELDKIPDQRKILITAHDAFGYFGQAYGIQVKALQGISTVGEYGLQDVSNMVGFIIDNEIPAIFVESSVSTRSSESIIAGAEERGHEVRIGGELFSDAMGSPDSEEGNYIGMFKHNVKAIVEGLK
ncbi:MAG: zinc ABC transporter substrate-binding protein [Balneolales bacterium]